MSIKFKTPIDVDGQVSTEYLDLSTTTTHTAGVGEMVWNNTDGTVDIGLKGGNVKLQVGQEQLARVVNKTSPLITLQESDYQVVIITGATGQRLSVKLAQGNNDANSAGTLGVVTETILPNQEGFITTSGAVREINTTGSLQGETWSDGDLLFLSPTVAGAITNIRPAAPNHTVNIGYVEYAHAVHGKIYVKIDNGYELGELHDVDTSESKTTPVDADNLLLQDSADQSVWKKLSWSNTKATLKTYFDTLYQSVLTNPITGTGTTNYVSKFTGATTLGNSQIFDDGTNVGIGTATPSYKLTVIGNGYFNDNVLIGNGSQLRFAVPGINIRPELVSSTWSDLSFSTNNSEKMRITSDGNVGIGTTSPTSKFTINDSTAFSWGFPSTASAKIGTPGTGGSFMVMTPSLNSSYESGFAVDGTYAGGKSVINLSAFGVYSGGPYSADIAFKTATNTTLSEKMRITNDGNVGIGTSSPVNTSGYGGLSLNGTNGAIISLFQGGSETFRVTNATGYSFINTTGATPLLLGTNATEYMRISSAGNVGIGTTSPSARLTTITNAAGWSGWIENQDTTGNGSGLVVTGGSNVGGFSMLVRKQDGTSTFAVTGSGNVGIGTTSPNFITTGRTVLSLNGSSTSLMEFQTGGSFKSYLYQSGTSFEIYETSTLLFSTGGSERMRITSSGNVGIGTTSPSARLNVSGDIHLGDYGSALSRALELRTNKGLFSITTDGVTNANGTTITYSWANGGHGPLKFNNASNEVMRLDASGNVGIGTTSPSTLLQVGYTNSSNQLLRLGVQYNTVRGLRGGINWHDGANTTGQISTEYDGSMVSMVFGSLYNSGYNSNNLMTLRGNGNVGIGTSSPSEKLEVQNGASGAKIKVSNSGGGYATLECSSNATSVAQLSFTNQLSLIGGNVGIGTSSPGGKLHVVGEGIFDDGTNGRLTFGNASGQNDIYSTTTAFSGWKNLRLSSNELILSSGGTTERMRITSSGNVGIGTSSPEQSAILELKSQSKGFLLPRITTSERDNINSPANGLMIFNIDNETVDVFTNGGGWRSLAFL